jgi:hypothetical protein
MVLHHAKKVFMKKLTTKANNVAIRIPKNIFQICQERRMNPRKEQNRKNHPVVVPRQKLMKQY